MNLKGRFDFKKNAVIVAHPDDETLWSGGTILMNPQCRWTIVCLCRGDDTDRAPRFLQALSIYGAAGTIGNLDDGPEQKSMPQKKIETAIQFLLPQVHYDLVITHSPAGEYTRHKRHEQIGRTVVHLWKQKKIDSDELWLFAYEDQNKTVYPRAILGADKIVELPEPVRLKKYNIITRTYGFSKKSFEAMTTPGKEAFWCYNRGGNIQE